MYPILTLKPGKERPLQGRHPWVFSGAVAAKPVEAQAGDIVAVHNAQGKWLALGHYAPQSQIVCRCFEFADASAPVTTADYWSARLAAAVAVRTLVGLPNADTNCYRLLHAEGEGIPGLVADAYAGTLAVQATTRGAERVLGLLADGLHALGFAHIYLKAGHNPGWQEQLELKEGWLGTPGPTLATVLEDGQKYEVDIAHGQKTGFFLDQRDARALVRRLARGRRVLNAFCYTGGFSVAALAGGAAYVESVDISAPAIAQTVGNVALNGYPTTAHAGVVADCFEHLRAVPQGAFDLIVLDPPAFAKREKDVPKAARGYKDINLQALRRIAPGGVLATFSCSGAVDEKLFTQIIFAAAQDAGRTVRILYHTTQPPDHPVSIYHPEGAYLKGLILHVE